MATIQSINISNGGVPKWPVASAQVTRNGIVGDKQAKPGIHGGIYRAVSLFSFEVIEQLIAEGHPIAPGSSGENLTVIGSDWCEMSPGTLWQVGSQVQLKITSFATPCPAIAGSFYDGDTTRLHHKKKPGRSRVYAQVMTEGVVAVGAEKA